MGPGSTNRPREPAKPAMAPETPTPRLDALVEKGRATMGKIKDTAGEKNKKNAGKHKDKDKEKDKDTKQKEKSAVVNVEEDDDDKDEDEYEYYSSSEEPPAKKAEKGSILFFEEEGRDGCAWLEEKTVELEAMLHKVTRENKSLWRQLSSERAKKSRKSRSWKKAVKSLLEAGSDSSTSKGDEKK